MIKQKRGHIVGVASGFGLYPCGRGVTYTTSKFAVRGFMMSLCEQLSYNHQAAYIKTTTIYPLFMATCQELTDTWQKLRWVSDNNKHCSLAIVNSLVICIMDHHHRDNYAINATNSLDELYVLLTPEWAAKVAVDGIKNNYEHLTIPKNLISILTGVALVFLPCLIFFSADCVLVPTGVTSGLHCGFL